MSCGEQCGPLEPVAGPADAPLERVSWEAGSRPIEDAYDDAFNTELSNIELIDQADGRGQHRRNVEPANAGPRS